LRIAIDTNVLVRFLTEDDERQTELATTAIEAADSVVVSTTVLCETVWVLSRAFKLPRRRVAQALRAFISSDRVEVNRLEAEAGLRYLSLGGDFADGVILLQAEQARADRLVTFDRDFARASAGSKLSLIVLDQ
jgi:predicted nucleic-acid-binding protein